MDGDYETIEEASSYGDGFKVEKINSKFTDTKQLEIIKWFGKNFDIIRYWINDSEYIVEINGRFGNNKDFSQALAGLVCELWEDLTDEQREEVRGILR